MDFSAASSRQVCPRSNLFVRHPFRSAGQVLLTAREDQPFQRFWWTSGPTSKRDLGNIA